MAIACKCLNFMWVQRAKVIAEPIAVAYCDICISNQECRTWLFIAIFILYECLFVFAYDPLESIDSIRGSDIKIRGRTNLAKRNHQKFVFFSAYVNCGIKSVQDLSNCAASLLQEPTMQISNARAHKISLNCHCHLHTPVDLQ